ncbi:MAG: hypothetical protein K1X86_12940 [Ignavibacteria bacterium]|nr:hypothetical protein [Ignavibacteria bacterium]
MNKLNELSGTFMITTNSIEILKNLDKKSLIRFGDFLKSPYFNSSPLMVKLFEIVKKEHPLFQGNSINRERIFKKLYPAEEYKEARIKNLFVDFGKLLKEFLGYEELNFKKKEFDILVAQNLKRLSLFDASNKFVKSSIQKNDEGSLSAPLNYSYLHSMNTCYISNLLSLRENANTEINSIQEMETERTAIFSLRELLFTAMSLSLRKELLVYDNEKKTYEEILKLFNIPEFLNYLKRTNNEYYSYLNIYYRLYLYTEGDVSREEYFELKKEIFNIVPLLGSEDKIHIITKAVQIILTKLVTKYRWFHKEVFELSKLFCEQKIYPDENMDWLKVTTLRDLLTSSLILREFDWAENFLEEYVNYIGAEYRKNEYNYWKGILSFKRGSYEDSLSYFNNVEQIDIVEKINIRFYYLMNFIELKAYESALSSLSTIRQFYRDRRDEIPEMFAVLIPTSLKYFNEIIKCEEEGNHFDEAYYNEAFAAGRYYHKLYIVEKIKQQYEKKT